MTLNARLNSVTDRIVVRSAKARARYLTQMKAARLEGPRRAHLSCGNQAHAYSSMKYDKDALSEGRGANVGIVTAYNDMLSAHHPFAKFPDEIKDKLRSLGATAQVAAGVPAMCDGVTQGQDGMELSLFSRDSIAMSAAIGLSHNVFDCAVFLGVCDKIVPGLVIAAARFGHLPAVFLPAGPMPSGLSNDEKTQVRKDFSEGKCDREALMSVEMASYHGAGTCTFYGTANSNQMLMEFMGLHLPGSSFVAPNTPLRAALTSEGARIVVGLSDLGSSYLPVSDILTEKAYVNGIVGLMATGGSTNLLIHLIAMARASGILLDWVDFQDIAEVVPLLTRIYPNGLADVNHFHAAGGLGLVVRELLGAGLLHDDTLTVVGRGLTHYTKEPKLIDGVLVWEECARVSLNTKIIATMEAPFEETGGLSALNGNLGHGVMKTSAVALERRVIIARCRVFHDQASVVAAFRAGEFSSDVVVVVRYQGPKANGMPELHGLTPCLAVLQDRGIKVALVSDGRMSGASGKVPAVIHLSPEAIDNGPIACLQDGDIVTVDAVAGVLSVEPSVLERKVTHPDLTECFGVGREMFDMFRERTGPACDGASIFEF